MKQEMIQLGIHISDQDLSLVALTSMETGIKVVAWERLVLENDQVDGGRIQEMAALAQPILRFIRRHKLCVEATTLSLTMNVARLKVTSLSANSDEALHEKIMQELERYAPYGRENTYGTYQILPHLTEFEGHSSVLQVMTSRVAGDNCLAVGQRIGLSLPVLEAAVLPLMRVLGQQAVLPAVGVSLLCAFDADAGMLCVFKGQALVFCQNLPVGTQALVNDRECLSHFEQVGIPVVEYARTLGDQKLTMFVTANSTYGDLRTTVMRIRHSFPQVQIKQLTAVQLTKLCGVSQDANNREIPILPLASALSMLRPHPLLDPLNLIPPSSLEKVSAQREMSRMGKVVIAVVLLAVAALVPVNMKTQNVQADSARFESQIVEAQPVHQQVEATQKKIRTAREQYEAYARGTQRFTVLPWHRLMALLVDKAPMGLRLMELITRDQGRFTVMGEAQTELVVHRFVQALENDPLIAHAEVEEVQYDYRSTLTLEYRIVAQMKVPEPNKP